MTVIERAIRESIIHHLRMRGWVLSPGGPSLNSRVNSRRMYHNTGEVWDAEGCALCRRYPHDNCTDDRRRLCPYKAKHGGCGQGIGRDPNTWIKMSRSKTWRQWLDASADVIRQLEGLLYDMYRSKSRGK